MVQGRLNHTHPTMVAKYSTPVILTYLLAKQHGVLYLELLLKLSHYSSLSQQHIYLLVKKQQQQHFIGHKPYPVPNTGEFMEMKKE